MYVDAQLLYRGLDRVEAEWLEAAAKECMLNGKMPDVDHPWIRKWLEAGSFDDRQARLVMGTVWPARVFYSLLLFIEEMSRV